MPSETKKRWWVYQRPVLRDWLFWVGIIAAIITVITVWTHRPRYTASALTFNTVLGIMGAMLGTGTLIGFVRELIRGLRGE